jgi:pyruvate kinase
MEFIKWAIFFLLIPAVTFGQTIHVDSNRIVYKGTVKLDSVNKEELFARAKYAIFNNVKEGKHSIVTDNKEKGIISAKGSIKLASPYHIIKKVEYILELSVDDGKYEYHIDSVSIKQVERGGKTTRIYSEELLKGLDVTVSGFVPGSAIVEKQVNEIDMNFQKLIDLVSADMERISFVKRE